MIHECPLIAERQGRTAVRPRPQPLSQDDHDQAGGTDALLRVQDRSLSRRTTMTKQGARTHCSASKQAQQLPHRQATQQPGKQSRHQNLPAENGQRCFTPLILLILLGVLAHS